MGEELGEVYLKDILAWEDWEKKVEVDRGVVGVVVGLVQAVAGEEEGRGEELVGGLREGVSFVSWEKEEEVLGAEREGLKEVVRGEEGTLTEGEEWGEEEIGKEEIGIWERRSPLGVATVRTPFESRVEN